MKHLLLIISTLFLLCSCNKGNKFLGKWKHQTLNGYVEISRSGEVYKMNVVEGNQSEEIAPITFKDDVLIYDPGNGFPVHKLFIESDGKLNLDGKILTKD